MEGKWCHWNALSRFLVATGPNCIPFCPPQGTQATRIEDDPTITPGSVARNPLSIAAAKESNLFGGSAASAASNSKSSPTESTWSFNPSGGAGGGLQGGNYGGKVQKNPWQDANTPTMPPADLWDTPLSGANGGKGRGVGMMGGIGKPGGGSKLDANGWNTPSTQAGGGSTWNSGASAANTWSSTWIMLRNLTAQVSVRSCGTSKHHSIPSHPPLYIFLSLLSFRLRDPLCVRCACSTVRW